MPIIKGILIVLGVLVAIIAIGPFLVPIPALQDTVPEESLADPDSHFIQVNGIKVHYKKLGEGEPVIFLLHGFGASLFSWREVMSPLAQYGTVIAYDRPAFGLTKRPMPGDWQGESPYGAPAQVEMLAGLMDAFKVQKAILVGNSAGGSIAASFALKYPGRVSGLVLVDAAVYGGGGPAWTRWLMATPQGNHLGPLLVRSILKSGDDLIRQAWHDPSQITPDVIAGYHRPLGANNWDRALWEFTRAGGNNSLASQVKDIQVPSLVITGDDDRIVPTEQSLRLGKEIPGATLVVIPACGHVPQEERPQAFLEAFLGFIQKIQ